MCRSISRTNDINKQDKLRKSVCLLCGKSDGFLKKLKIEKDDKISWIHICCMSWFIGIKLCFEDGFSVFKMEKKFEDYIWMEEDCNSCKKTVNDFFIKCSKLNCNKCFHSKCASTMSKSIDYIISDKIKYKIFVCEEHASNILIHKYLLYLFIIVGKKTNNALADVKSYGKNVNVNTEDNDFIPPDTKTR